MLAREEGGDIGAKQDSPEKEYDAFGICGAGDFLGEARLLERLATCFLFLSGELPASRFATKDRPLCTPAELALITGLPPVSGGGGGGHGLGACGAFTGTAGGLAALDEAGD